MILENKSLKAYNTFGIDATTSYFGRFSSVEELIPILRNYSKEELLILGGGSNVLFVKDHFEGLVLVNEIKGFEIVEDTSDFAIVKVGGGEVWHEFVLKCIEKGLCGVENLSLIPGSVGASPMQNIGAYGVEIKDVFYELEALHIKTGEIHKFNLQDCQFGYRESVFKNKQKGEYIITSVTYKLNKTPVFNTSYGAIDKELENMGVKELSISAISQAVCNIRTSKLPNPKEIGNAGSFFKNPIISASLFEKLKQEFPDMPSYPQSLNEVKTAAGWLIERCGWKGRQIGDAGVHKNQALVLVNYNKATGSEIFDLSSKIIADVKGKFGIELEREVNII